MTLTRLLRPSAFLILSLLFVFPSFSQSRSPITVNGEIAESETGKSVPFSTVTIVDSLKNIITAVAADGNGKFTLGLKETGSYILVVTSVGYSQYQGPLEIEETGRVNVGKILLEQGLEVDVIQVTAQKPLITADAEKMTYSVESDPDAETSTLAEIIRKIPQLSMDGDGNVLLNGQSDYKVLVNGKSSSMMARNFKDVIKSMPANSVRDIEVITNPSTKYESEGVGGIINIITARRNIDGYSGRIGVGAGVPESYNGNAYVSAQFGKFTISGNYWMGRYKFPKSHGYMDQTNFLIPDKYYSRTENHSTGHSFNNSGSIEASYEIDSLRLLSLSVSLWSGSYKSKYVADYAAWDRDSVMTYQGSSLGNSKNSYGSISGSLDYQRTFVKPDQTFTVSYKIEASPTKNRNDSRLDSVIINGVRDPRATIRRSNNTATGMEHTVQADYYDPLSSKHHIEAGVKYILRTNDSDTDRELFENELWIPDLITSNGDLDYTQHIFGAYGGYLFKLNKFSTKAGFRMEGTWNDGKAKTLTGNINFDNTQFNVVPYAQLSYMIKPTQSLSLAYTQRLQRPGIWYLNPYVDDTDPTHISYGNPDLDAVVSHSLSLNYRMFSQAWSFFLGVNSSLSNNSITRITRVIDNPVGDYQTGVLETTYENIGKNRHIGFYGSLSYRLNTVFSTNLGFHGNYSYLEAKSQLLSNEGFTYGGYMGVNVSLWKNGRFHANGNAWSAHYSLQGKGSFMYYTSFVISQSLFKQKLDLSLSVQDPYRKNRKNTSTTVDSAFENKSVNYSRARRFNFYIGYRFGKMDVSVKKARRGITNDDKMSGGGGQGSGEGGGQ